MCTPIADPVLKEQNKLAYEAKKRKEQTKFVLNPDCPLPKIFLHKRIG